MNAMVHLSRHRSVLPSIRVLVNNATSGLPANGLSVTRHVIVSAT